jgi:hypothetical protein
MMTPDWGGCVGRAWGVSFGSAASEAKRGERAVYVVILKGGGDAGGWIITEKGIKPIPPWNPDLLRDIYTINHFVHAAEQDRGVAKTVERHLSGLTASVADAVSAQVAELDPGAAEGGGAIAFDDVDGGFVCGSTGKPPFPFPLPGGNDLSFEELGASGFR